MLRTQVDSRSIPVVDGAFNQRQTGACLQAVEHDLRARGETSTSRTTKSAGGSASTRWAPVLTSITPNSRVVDAAVRRHARLATSTAQ
jgi:hypothetical protein